MTVPTQLREQLQKKVNDLASAKNSRDLIYGAQRHMPAGSTRRDDTADGFAEANNQAGELTRELHQAGIIDDWGNLTAAALEMGLTRPWRVGDRL